MPSTPIERPAKKYSKKLSLWFDIGNKRVVVFKEPLKVLKDNAHSNIPPIIFEYFWKVTLAKKPTLAPKKHKQKTVIAMVIIHFNLAFVFNASESPQKNESILTEIEVNNKVKIFISNKVP